MASMVYLPTGKARMRYSPFTSLRAMRIPGLSKDCLGPRADVVGRVEVAVGLAEYQVVGSIARSESSHVLLLFLPVCRKDVKGKIVQADAARLAGLRALDSQAGTRLLETLRNG